MADFDWHAGEGKESIVVPQVDAVAVYSNTKGDIVIRQQHPMGEDDAVVIVPKRHVGALVAAIRKAAKEGATGG